MNIYDTGHKKCDILSENVNSLKKTEKVRDRPNDYAHG